MTDHSFFTLAQGSSSDVMTGAGSTPAATGTSVAPNTPAGPTATQPQSPMSVLLFPLILIAGMFLLMTITRRGDAKKRNALMNALKKGDKVLTIGGQIGTVDQVRDTEVVLKVDENSNARARFTKAAIQQIIESAPGSPDTVGTVEVKAKNESPALTR